METTTVVFNKIITRGYGASGALIGGETLKPMDFERDAPQADELLIEVLYCGVCHSDVHQVENDWKNTIYPCVPGHEVIGRVTYAGEAVTKFKVGDVVGVGCMVDSCKTCSACQEGEEQFCEHPHGPTMTYNGYFIADGSGYNTFGGYSNNLVVKEDFVLRIPVGLDIRKAAPILCAGITTYSPLNHWGVKAGDKVAIVGIGGLGHMGVMIAKAMGAEVTAITTKEEKRELAKELGADSVIVSDNEEEMKRYEKYFNFILVTIPDPFDITPYISLIHRRGSLVTVGLLAPYEKPLNNMEIASQARSVGGSLIGGIAETQEVLDFCAEHNILPQVELIDIPEINEAYEKVKDEDVRFRYVIDMASINNQTAK
ncbi:NAD(P)-dependent alcohol dehydrogenase [Mucilaginibacter agri]|uniref:Alcohol dehydrogenase catalytic domain-containing protein n=1 Tax=Mucilaginibacter agri TaxID=2695265 RepID=A0A965ZEK5_9SPHI|nr:NAD(P)-dependent alcohol dehydrogenase [Mucilaginibacter agri]NCD68342.1 alcohol dehydrogenase catalytic domain-containing protein [Mucilaginibacter agri]